MCNVLFYALFFGLLLTPARKRSEGGKRQSSPCEIIRLPVSNSQFFHKERNPTCGLGFVRFFKALLAHPYFFCSSWRDVAPGRSRRLCCACRSEILISLQIIPPVVRRQA
ncbi:hypothetical protein GWI33_002681 [Rhynchophorus ferrugineus]|uniref:Secreted protein n=1 Tax=Rhynchophorus ferrugineus TaxID=354439 RepID=A0A834IMB3_RHYFE|nr:hypothetical protein GWI33_002681 [Rhynchophorus ferrugineus]